MTEVSTVRRYLLRATYLLILVGLIVFDKELGIIHMITGTFAKGLSGTILSTALGLRPGVAE